MLEKNLVNIKIVWLSTPGQSEQPQVLENVEHCGGKPEQADTETVLHH